MFPASYGSPLEVSPDWPEMGSSPVGLLSPQTALAAAEAMLFTVSMV